MDPLSPYRTTRYPKYTNRYPKCPCLFRRLICAKNRCGDFFMLLIFRKYMSKFDWFTIWSRNMKSCGSATIMLVWFVIVERIKLWYAWNFLIRHITKSDIFLFYFQLLKGMVNVKISLTNSTNKNLSFSYLLLEFLPLFCRDRSSNPNLSSIQSSNVPHWSIHVYN